MSFGQQPEYRLGETIQWYRDVDGTVVQPFLTFDSGDYENAWNCGDPEAVKAIFCDYHISYFYDLPTICPDCGFGSRALITVENDVIIEVRGAGVEEAEALFGAPLGDVDVVTYTADGTGTRRYDLFDPSLTFRDDHPLAKR